MNSHIGKIKRHSVGEDNTNRVSGTTSFIDPIHEENAEEDGDDEASETNSPVARSRSKAGGPKWGNLNPHR